MSDKCCEFCLAGTGPLLERSLPYDGREGRVLESTVWKPYAKAVELEDGWVAVWEHLSSDAALVCPLHAEGKTVPRAPGTALVGGVTVDLQKFDYVGARGNVAMFKHIQTQRYMNLCEVGPTAVAVHREDGKLSYRPVSEALRSARPAMTLLKARLWMNTVSAGRSLRGEGRIHVARILRVGRSTLYRAIGQKS